MRDIGVPLAVHLEEHSQSVKSDSRKDHTELSTQYLLPVSWPSPNPAGGSWVE